MTANWTFLEPWHAALSVTTELSPRVPADSGTVMNVSITWPYLHGPCLQLYVELHLEGRNPQDMIQLKQIREAIELFTALSLMNNKVFREQFPHFTRSTGQGEGIWYPVWNLHVSGSLTAQNVAWSRLLDDLEPSPQFQRAIRMIKAVEVEEAVITKNPSCPYMEWKCEFDGTVVKAALTFDNEDKDVRRLFDAGVSMIAHLSLTPHTARLVDIWHNQRPVSAHLTLSIQDLHSPFCRDLAAGLVRTPINDLIIKFDEEKMTNDAQTMMNADVLIKRIYQWSQMVSDDIEIRCWNVSQRVFIAICSAISVGFTTTPIEIDLKSVSTELWPWLVYAISCSSSPDILLRIWDADLVQSDLSRIAGVLRCNYPHSKEPTSTLASLFGFVDIIKGTTLWCLDLEGLPFTVSNSFRCRAWFKEENIVEVVIPGIGLCRSRIGDGISVVSRDIEEQNTLKSNALHSLYVSFTPIESVSLVTSLLELIGVNLRAVSLRIHPDSSDRALDLSVLSAVCPNLESLTTYDFDVVVSTHNEALRLWPIKMMYITDSRKLADIPACLRNSSLRMTRKLERLAVRFDEQEFDERDTQEVRAHDGDFLSVVKEPFPIQSKTAMISVVNSAHTSKAAQRLHADVLRIIYVLASTPAQRSVDFWANRRR